ncbi:MAG: BF3164 family lipoprotein [Paludibacter sp.]|nr:BF3164 family lipoprotein [Paludibacter sp.]
MRILCKKLARLLILIVIVIGCTSVGKEKTDITFNSNYTLKHKVYDTELFISYGRIAVIDTFLIVVSNQKDFFCKVYSIPGNMKELYSYGYIGNGPGEFLQPMLTYSYNNTFGLNELNKQELAIMQLVNSNNNLSIIEQARLKAPYEMKKGELNPPDYYFSKLNDTHYVSLLCAGQDRFFSLFDCTLTHISQFGESPIPEELSVLSSRNQLQGRIATSNGTMVFATSNLPYLSCYQLKNDKMQKQWSFFYGQVYYGVRNGDLLFDKEKSFGQVLDLEMDTQYIYVLYLDQLLSEYNYKQTDKSLANKILVFDYKGNAVAKLHLSCRINEMAISGDQTKLFGIAQLPEPTLVEFDLPQKLTN